MNLVLLVHFGLASINIFNPGPVLVDPSQVDCLKEAEIDQVAYRTNVSQVYASLCGLCDRDDCKGTLFSVASIAGDMQVYHQDLYFEYEGKRENFEILVKKLVKLADNDEKVYSADGKQKFYKKVVIDCFSARLTVTTRGRRAVGSI
jgi:hypothetical protein